MQVHLLDATYELFRAHFGRPPRSGRDGEPVGATLGVVESVLSLLRSDGVTHLGCATDSVIHSWRNDRYAGYKTDEGMPPELLAQFPVNGKLPQLPRLPALPKLGKIALAAVVCSGLALGAVAFLSDAVRSMMGREPTASCAIVARHPEQADAYFEGLRRAEVPALRRVRRDEFSFQPGVDVTDVANVKGLEFDYVIMIDVNDTSYPDASWARHLLHIGVTRAAHQLWLVSTGDPSPLIPAALRDGGRMVVG